MSDNKKDNVLPFPQLITIKNGNGGNGGDGGDIERRVCLLEDNAKETTKALNGIERKLTEIRGDFNTEMATMRGDFNTEFAKLEKNLSHMLTWSKLGTGIVGLAGILSFLVTLAALLKSWF